jgi:undecaprenyl-diphosphatase
MINIDTYRQRRSMTDLSAWRRWITGLPFINWMRRAGKKEIVFLVSLLILAGGVWAFAALADEVMEGETSTFDERILLALRSPDDLSDPIGPLWFEEMMRDFTALGGMGLVILLMLAVCGHLWLQQKHRMAVLVLIAVGGGILISFLLKFGFDRPRPDLVPHGSEVYTTSFPSGHAMMSAAAYLTLGALLASVQKLRRTRAYLMMLALLVTIVIGFSRVYLGVHWPTDVLAGWTSGTLWAILCWQGAQWLRYRGQIEQTGPEAEETPEPAPEELAG